MDGKRSPGHDFAHGLGRPRSADELLRLARRADRSLSAEVRRAVARYLERDKQEEATHAAPRP